MTKQLDIHAAAAALGRKGGKSKSEAKQQASRANGKRGGRGYKMYNAYILEHNWNRRAASDAIRLRWDSIRANSRRAALDQIMPEIITYLLGNPPHQEGSRPPIVAVYVGERRNPTAYANRLDPYRLRATGEVIE